MFKGVESEIGVAWFELLWDCARSLNDFHYFYRSPALSPSELAIVERFNLIIEEYIDDDSEDRVQKVIDKLKHFSLNPFAGYLQSIKNTSSEAKTQYNKDWTLCYIFLGLMKILNKKYPDVVTLMCQRSFESTDVLRDYRFFANNNGSPSIEELPETAAIVNKVSSGDSLAVAEETRSPASEKVSADSIRRLKQIRKNISKSVQFKIDNRENEKIQKLCNQVIQLFEESLDQEKILRKGMQITARMKDIRRLEPVALKLQKRLKCDLVFKEENGTYKNRIRYHSKKADPADTAESTKVASSVSSKKIDTSKIKANAGEDRTRVLFDRIVREFFEIEDKTKIMKKGLVVFARPNDYPLLLKVQEEISQIIQCKVFIREQRATSDKTLNFGKQPPKNYRKQQDAIETTRLPLKIADLKQENPKKREGYVKKAESPKMKRLEKNKPEPAKKLKKVKPAKSDTAEAKKVAVDKKKLETAEVREKKSLTEKYGPGFLSGLIHVTLFVIMAAFLVTKFIDQPKEVVVTIAKEEPIEEIIELPEFESEDQLEISEPEPAMAMQKMSDAEVKEIEAASDEAFEKEVADLAEADIEITEIVVPTSSLRGIKASVKPLKKSAFSGRDPKNRNALLKKFGGTKAGQQALLRGLRWLKNNQNPDGSWSQAAGRGGNKEAMSGLAMLAFLAYGAKPDHQEFGETVERGLKWMLETERNQRTQQIGRPGSGYQHPIFTFAICEASGLMLENSELKEAMDNCVKTMLDGQCEDGGFPYVYGKGRSNSALTLTGWNALAVKAALNAGCTVDGLHDSTYGIVRYLKSRHVPNEGFRYGGAPNGAHRGIGTIGLQFFNEGKCNEALNVIRVIDKTDVKNITNERLYGLYYLNQAAFNHGGKLWKKWAPDLQRHLIKKQDQDGFWTGGYGGSSMSTSLACLMLTVFYRYPPAYEGTNILTRAERLQAEKDKREEELLGQELSEEGMDIITE